MQCLDAISKMTEWSLLCSFSRQIPFNITVIQVYALTSNAEEAEVERLYEDLQDLLELTPKKDVLFIIGDWNAKVGSQEIPEVTGRFSLGVQNEASQGLTEFCQENTLLRVSWTARISNQSILKEISPEYSLEGLMLKLKLQYFGHLMQGTEFSYTLTKTHSLSTTQPSLLSSPVGVVELRAFSW